jgi:hypothetical protein
MLGSFKVPGLRALALAASSRIAHRAVRNLAAVAEARATG